VHPEQGSTLTSLPGPARWFPRKRDAAIGNEGSYSKTSSHRAGGFFMSLGLTSSPW
jgi:hypothetical protein